MTSAILFPTSMVEINSFGFLKKIERMRDVIPPLRSISKRSLSTDTKATVERSDPTALPAAGVVMESVVATVVANEILDKFSSDNMEELKEAVARHRDYVKNF